MSTRKESSAPAPELDLARYVSSAPHARPDIVAGRHGGKGASTSEAPASAGFGARDSGSLDRTTLVVAGVVITGAVVSNRHAHWRHRLSGAVAGKPTAGGEGGERCPA